VNEKNVKNVQSIHNLIYSSGSRTVIKYGSGSDFFNYLCTYDLYGPVRKVFDAGRYFMWGGGGGVGAGNLEFCGSL
jgi:hypothetical protein